MVTYGDIIREYISENLYIDDAFTARDIAEKLGIEINAIRFHLNSMVKHGELCKVKIDNVVYYFDGVWWELFDDKFNKFEKLVY